VSAVADLLGREAVVLDPGELQVVGPLQASPHVGTKRRLVVLDRQQVVVPVGADLLGDRLLAAGGVDADQRPVQVEHLQQLGDGRDLVALALDGHLGQAQAMPGGPGAGQVQAGAVGATCAAQRLAVDGDVAEAQGAADGVDPRREGALEGQGFPGLRRRG
jgi:hypothetical protein